MRIGKTTFSLIWPDLFSSTETRTRRSENDERRRKENLPIPKRFAFIKRDKAKSAQFLRQLSMARTNLPLDFSKPTPHVSNFNSDSRKPSIQSSDNSRVDHVRNGLLSPSYRSESPLRRFAPSHKQEMAGVTETTVQASQSTSFPSNEITELLQRQLPETWLTRLKNKDGDWLRAFQLLVKKDGEWTNANFKNIQDLSSQKLHHLLELLTYYEEWTKENFNVIHSMDMKGLLLHLQNDFQWTKTNFLKLRAIEDISGLVPLVQKNKIWTTKNIHAVAQFDKSKLDALSQVLENYEDWTIENFQRLRRINTRALYVLPHFLHNQVEWVTSRLDAIREMDPNTIEKLVPLLKSHREWTLSNFDEIKTLHGEAIKTLLKLLQEKWEWTAMNFSLIKQSLQNHKLLDLFNRDTDWVMKNLALLQRMSHMTSLMFWEYYENNKEHIAALDGIDLKKLAEMQDAAQDKELEARKFFLQLMDKDANGLHSAANPFMREFQRSPKISGDDEILRSNGASRSTLALHSNRKFSVNSFLIQRFNRNYALLPEATFGVENEMYIPAIPDNSTEFGKSMNLQLGTENYSYVDDHSIQPAYVAKPIEQVTSILRSSADIQKLQNAMSIINDWGGFTNQSTGVHIHTGITQWKTSHVVKNQLASEHNFQVAQWDIANNENITPFQLLAMKQFIVNMASIQEDFYRISRESNFNQRNAPENPEELAVFYKEVAAASDLRSLIQVGQRHGRNSCINLHAFYKLGTVEVRGFTKKNSDHMGVDPNIPVRDIIFLQDVLISTLKCLKKVLLSGAAPLEAHRIEPDENLKEVVKDYIQDVLLLQIVHALCQREVGKRIKTMEAILSDKENISASTLERLREGWSHLVGNDADRLTQHFFHVLHGKEKWNPFFNGLTPLRRRHSLRFAADAVIRKSGNA